MFITWCFGCSQALVYPLSLQNFSVPQNPFCALSVSLWNDTSHPACLMVWDSGVLRAVPMLFSWPNLFFLFVSYYFLVLFLSLVDCVGLGSQNWQSVLTLSQTCTADSFLIIITIINPVLPETILKTLYTSLIHPCLSYGVEAWHGTYQNYFSKIFVLLKKAIRAINNLAYIEYTNTLFKYNKILKLSDQYNLPVSNYSVQLLHFNIDEEIESSLLVNNQIHSHDTRSNNQMSILRVSRTKTKYCVFHNGIESQRFLLVVQELGAKFFL